MRVHRTPWSLIGAVAASFASCSSYDLSRLDLDAAVAQPTLATPTDQSERLRTVVWISRPSERSRTGRLTPDEYSISTSANTVWRLPDIQGGGYVELELPAAIFIGLGAQFGSRNTTTTDMIELRVGIQDKKRHSTIRSSLGAFVGRLRARAVYEMHESGDLVGTSGRQTTRGFFAEGILIADQPQEPTAPFIAVAIVRQDLFSYTIGYNSSGDPVKEIQTMYLYSITPGLDIPITNATKLTIAVRFILDASISGTVPGMFLLPQAQFSSTF